MINRRNLMVAAAAASITPSPAFTKPKPNVIIHPSIVRMEHSRFVENNIITIVSNYLDFLNVCENTYETHNFLNHESLVLVREHHEGQIPPYITFGGVLKAPHVSKSNKMNAFEEWENTTINHLKNQTFWETLRTNQIESLLT